VTADSLAKEVARLAGLAPTRVVAEESLAPRTAFRVGGPAEVFALAQTVEEVVRLVAAARELGLPWRILGRGTNLLVADAGVRGLVIANRAEGIETRRIEQEAVVQAEAGAVLRDLALNTCMGGYGGLEFAAHIPGTVGGGVTGNAGAFGGQMADVLTAVDVLLADGAVATLSLAQLELGYRTSRFRQPEHRDEVVLRAKTRLRRAEVPVLLAQVEANRQTRERTQPSGRCAGSVFRNPPQGAAGYFIEQAGLKGHMVGRARVSSVHANFIMNDGNATATEVWALINLMRERVRERFGVELELEIQLWGEIGP
jgi:UDP-N-acetylmuramate dehydrogenase